MRIVKAALAAALILSVASGCLVPQLPSPSWDGLTGSGPLASPLVEAQPQNQIPPVGPAEPNVIPDMVETPKDVEVQPGATDAVDPYPVRPKQTKLRCYDAVKKAAAVHWSDTNNDEVYVTLIACKTVNDWAASVVSHPGIFGLSKIGYDEIPYLISVVCYGAMDTPLCQAAYTQQ